MRPTNLSSIDTGYRVVEGSIETAKGPSGYRIDGERILNGCVDTGCFLSGETIYRKPKLDTGFRVSSGIIWGPGLELPFLSQAPERPLAKTTKIDPLTAQAPAPPA